MTYIYEPTGRAREYSPLALNHYAGCDHGCKYCYGPGATRGMMTNLIAQPRKIDLDTLDREAENANQQVLLSFLGDPYCRLEKTERWTRTILEHLLPRGVPVALLTKGGSRCLADVDLYREYRSQIMVGASLTVWDESEEPGAATMIDRIGTIRTLRDNGIMTWASFEPIIKLEDTLEIMELTWAYLDVMKIGTLNHDPRARDIDWHDAGHRIVSRVMDLDRANGGLHPRIYIKCDLWKQLSDTDRRILQDDYGVSRNPDTYALKALESFGGD